MITHIFDLEVIFGFFVAMVLGYEGHGFEQDVVFTLNKNEGDYR